MRGNGRIGGGAIPTTDGLLCYQLHFFELSSTLYVQSYSIAIFRIIERMTFARTFENSYDNPALKKSNTAFSCC